MTVDPSRAESRDCRGSPCRLRLPCPPSRARSRGCSLRIASGCRCGTRSRRSSGEAAPRHCGVSPRNPARPGDSRCRAAPRARSPPGSDRPRRVRAPRRGRCPPRVLHRRGSPGSRPARTTGSRSRCRPVPRSLRPRLGPAARRAISAKQNAIPSRFDISRLLLWPQRISALEMTPADSPSSGRVRRTAAIPPLRIYAPHPVAGESCARV